MAAKGAPMVHAPVDVAAVAADAPPAPPDHEKFRLGQESGPLADLGCHFNLGHAPWLQDGWLLRQLTSIVLDVFFIRLDGVRSADMLPPGPKNHSSFLAEQDKPTSLRPWTRSSVRSWCSESHDETRLLTFPSQPS